MSSRRHRALAKIRYHALAMRSTNPHLKYLLLFALASVAGCGQSSKDDVEGSGGTGGSSENIASGGAAQDGSGGDGTGGESIDDTITYFKASTSNFDALFGFESALSADGSTLAIAAIGESSGAGAVYVFVNSAGHWQQAAQLLAPNGEADDRFGAAIAISSDGSTIAVGAPYEASSARGVDGDANDNSASKAGAVYVFQRDGEAWLSQGYLKASNADESDFFGISLALSADGETLAVGAEGEDGAGSGVTADPTDWGVLESGAVYVFSRSATSWTQSAYLKPSHPDILDHFGGAVALSAAGTTLAVGAYWEEGAGGDDPDPSDNSALSAGAVYVFDHDGSSWVESSYVKPTSSDGLAGDDFGASVALSDDGTVLLAGAPGDAEYAGAAHVFTRGPTGFVQQASLRATSAGAGDEFGNFVDLSGDGGLAVVGAALEGSGSQGLNGPSEDDSAAEAGAAYVFEKRDSGWQTRTYVKAPNTETGDRFGWAPELSADGRSLVVGATREDSAATGVDGDRSDNTRASAGAVYLYSDF